MANALTGWLRRPWAGGLGLRPVVGTNTPRLPTAIPHFVVLGRPRPHPPLLHLRQTCTSCAWEEGFRSGAAAHVPTLRDTGGKPGAD